MPLILQVSDLKPGMRLANNIMRDFNVLMARGHELTEKDIKYLERLEYSLSVHVDDPALQETIGLEGQTEQISEEVSHTLKKNIDTVAQKVKNLMSNGKSLSKAQVTEIEKTILDMLDYIQSNPLTMNILEEYTNWHSYLQEHGMTVFNLSLILGYALKDRMEQLNASGPGGSSQNKVSTRGLTPLSTAALFHDIGMIPIQHLYDKTDPLVDAELNSIKAHPIVSAELLPDGIDSTVRKAVLDHHENYDGSGYMEGLKGDKISIGGRILRISDAFAAAISEKKFHKAKSPIHVAYEMLHGQYSHCYDPLLVHLFACTIQPLPIGAKLKLNTGQFAVVVRHNFKNPFDPQIIIAYDDQGRLLPNSQLDKPFSLTESEEIEVISFGNIDLRFLNTPIPASDLADNKSLMQKAYNELFQLAGVKV
ncbi:MAG: HD domain-containing protein [Sedimentisphaerales bacterium]|nr:HD domain-containing protein [Sedimentisphaerales bacterium]